jgi:glyoxylate utilization-related uncharacterized protein
VTITVLEVAEVPAVSDGGASLRRFLNEDTVGAHLVEGIAYELPAGEELEVEPDATRHQLVYVTGGNLSAQFQGEQHDLSVGRGVYCEPGEGCKLENTADAPASFYRFLVAGS